jgi:GNAT superfamily N-acetyltransferase
MTGRRIRPSELVFRAATPSRWKDVERLFGERGACGGCWCMVWRLKNKDWIAGKGSANKRALRQLVASGRKPGILAYHEEVPVAWCAVAPREEYGFLERSRVLARVDDKPVWSVSCLFVARPYRRRGVSVPLLRAATEMARKRGATIVEGYPVEPGVQKSPDPFLWLGVPGSFRKAGFREVARRSPKRPIMRRIFAASLAALLTLATAAPTSAEQAEVRFKGQRLFEPDSGLTVLPDETKDHLFLSSTSHNYWLVLPYSESWVLESGKKLPLEGTDGRYSVHVRREPKKQAGAEAFLRSRLAEIAESRARPAHDATMLEAHDRPILRVQTKSTNPDRPWTWSFITVAPRGRHWYLLELTLDGDEELERETEMRILDICGAGFGADFDLD